MEAVLDTEIAAINAQEEVEKALERPKAEADRAAGIAVMALRPAA